MFYTLHVVEPLHYDSILIKETNNWMNEFYLELLTCYSYVKSFMLSTTT